MTHDVPWKGPSTNTKFHIVTWIGWEAMMMSMMMRMKMRIVRLRPHCNILWSPKKPFYQRALPSITEHHRTLLSTSEPRTLRFTTLTTNALFSVLQPTSTSTSTLLTNLYSGLYFHSILCGPFDHLTAFYDTDTGRMMISMRSRWVDFTNLNVKKFLAGQAA